MSASPRISSPLRHLVMAAVAAILTGCASAPQNASPQATPTAGTPESAAKLVDTADFIKKAQDEGWRPEISNGEVLYCKDETPISSRLPERTCLNKVGVEQMMLAEERQREQMQRPGAAPCPQVGSC
jgi:hypothetical protein